MRLRQTYRNDERRHKEEREKGIMNDELMDVWNGEHKNKKKWKWKNGNGKNLLEKMQKIGRNIRPKNTYREIQFKETYSR
jgi:hypothetical protein